MEKKRKKKFLKMPRFGGEKGLLKKIIKKNLQYPEEALEKRIEGDVILSYKVNNLGEVYNCNVIKGIGHGCDEEAVRLVKMLKYQEVDNRGVKVSTNNRIKIPFRLPKEKKSKISMKYTVSEKKEIKKEKQKPEKGNSYNYTISIKE